MLPDWGIYELLRKNACNTKSDLSTSSGNINIQHFFKYISTSIICERFLHFSLYDPTGNKQPIKEYNEDTLTPPLPNTKMISHN